jgi:asparagine synthase (glutamine-hydrolysing)
MCGIVGLIKPFETVEPDEIMRMRDVMVHRGPDDAGVWVSADHAVGLGHRRLSIIDLSPLGGQPMCNEDETLWLVYNGEIYNFLNLRRELQSKGHNFRSRADSEVVLHAYEEWGTDCLQHFNGMFAFAIWDTNSKKLFAARDRLGIKPFYYWRGEHGSLAFASQLKALFYAPGFKKEVDPESLWLYLAFRRVPSPRSIFVQCASLSPGYYLIWDAEKKDLILNQYWDAADFCKGEPLYGDSHEITEQFESLLKNAVRIRLFSDVPLGAFLSGGIDSSTVVSLMTEIGANVRTFTVGFNKGKIDEAPYGRQVAQHLGADHEDMYVSHQEAMKAVPELPCFYDEPFADSSAIPTYWLSKLARDYVTVALSGDGGDELFGGYGHYLSIPRWAGMLRRLKPVSPLLSKIADLMPTNKVGLGLHRLSLLSLDDLLQDFTGAWRWYELQQLMPDVKMTASVCWPKVPERDGMPIVNWLMLNDLKNYLPDEMLTKIDRASMAVSLEARVPLLDHRVVEFVLRLPQDYKIRNGTQKWLLRQVLARFLPAELINRPKCGFGAPLDSWLRNDLRWMVDVYLNPEHIRRQGLFDVNTVDVAVQRFLSGKSHHFRVWALIVFQMWAGQYGVI